MSLRNVNSPKEGLVMKTQIGLAMGKAGIKGADIRRALDVGEAMVSRW